MPVHADLVVDRVDEALARALAAGARQEGDVRDADWGRIAQVADPFGHGWCLIEFSRRGYSALVAP
jgi:lactoylglutathione lyase